MTHFVCVGNAKCSNKLCHACCVLIGNCALVSHQNAHLRVKYQSLISRLDNEFRLSIDDRSVLSIDYKQGPTSQPTLIGRPIGWKGKSRVDAPAEFTFQLNSTQVVQTIKMKSILCYNWVAGGDSAQLHVMAISGTNGNSLSSNNSSSTVNDNRNGNGSAANQSATSNGTTLSSSSISNAASLSSSSSSSSSRLVQTIATNERKKLNQSITAARRAANNRTSSTNDNNGGVSFIRAPSHRIHQQQQQHPIIYTEPSSDDDD
jgi:hypothetical protein